LNAFAQTFGRNYFFLVLGDDLFRIFERDSSDSVLTPSNETWSSAYNTCFTRDIFAQWANEV